MIGSAHAQGLAHAQGGAADAGAMNIVFIVLMFALLYFMLIRPQMKRAKEHKAMLDALEKGSEVVTAGGLVGKVTKISDAYVTVEIANNTEVVMQKQAIQTLLPKGSIKAI